MTPLRTQVFIDGFNLYHGLADTGCHHLKWLNVRALAERVLPRNSYSVKEIYYFSAYAEHFPDKAARHKSYVAALGAHGVIPIMGEFKEKDRMFSCECGDKRVRFVMREEKQTDVNIALAVLNEAWKNSYDAAFIITADSDLAPVLRMVKNNFPDKKIIIGRPPNRGSKLLKRLADNTIKIKTESIEKCLFPEEVIDVGGILWQRCLWSTGKLTKAKANEELFELMLSGFAVVIAPVPNGLSKVSRDTH